MIAVIENKLYMLKEILTPNFVITERKSTE